MRGHRKGINWAGLVIGLIPAGICLFLVLPAALSNNPFFATKWVSEKPLQAVIYYQGETYPLEPGDPDYDLLVEACNKTLARENGYRLCMPATFRLASIQSAATDAPSAAIPTSSTAGQKRLPVPAMRELKSSPPK